MGFDLAVGFVLTPLIIRHVGRAGYGIWTLVGSFLGYYGLLNIGVESAMTRYVSRYAGQEDQDAMNRAVSTAMAMFCCTGILALGLSILLAHPLARFFEVSPDHVKSFRHVVMLLGLATAISFPGGVLTGVLVAHERFVLANGVHIGAATLRAGTIVILLLRGFGLQGVAIATVVSQATGLLVNAIVVKGCAPNLRIHHSLAKLGLLGMLLSYGGAATVIRVADIMRVNLDSVVIGKWVGLSAVGVYGIAVLIKRYAFRVVTQGMRVLGPRFAALDGAGEHEKARILLQKALAIAGFLSFGGGLIVLSFGGHFIRLWVGEGFEEGVVVLRILAVCTAVAVAQNPAVVFLYSLNRHYWYAAVTMSEAIANVALSITLVFKYGIVGVALGTMIPMLFVKVLIMPLYVSRIAGLSVTAYVRPLLPSLGVAAALLVVVYHLGIVTGPTPSLVLLLVYGLITGGLYAAAGYLLIVRRYGRIL
jgi:O-antigen/teichoic acid export membrane protein